MHIVLFIIALLILVVGPGFWVKRVMKRYHEPSERYGRTGGETARTLLDELNLGDVRTEMTEGLDLDGATRIIDSLEDFDLQWLQESPDRGPGETTRRQRPRHPDRHAN